MLINTILPLIQVWVKFNLKQLPHSKLVLVLVRSHQALDNVVCDGWTPLLSNSLWKYWSFCHHQECILLSTAPDPLVHEGSNFAHPLAVFCLWKSNYWLYLLPLSCPYLTTLAAQLWVLVTPTNGTCIAQGATITSAAIFAAVTDNITNFYDTIEHNWSAINKYSPIRNASVIIGIHVIVLVWLSMYFKLSSDMPPFIWWQCWQPDFFGDCVLYKHH